jgi:short-subunit dehydrogenase
MDAETVLITGASSGLGLELAKLFAADGSGLILVARSQDKLALLAEDLGRQHGVPVRVMAKDLGDPTAPEQIVAELQRQGVRVDVLVNNAGFGALGHVASLDLNRQLDMVQVNITAPTHLTRLLLPGMLERRNGGILNIASTAAFQPGPNMAVYYATKAFLLSFSEALGDEVRSKNVKVCCLTPGPMATNFAAEAGMEGTRLFRLGALDARTVACAGYRGFRKGRVLVVPGWRNRLSVFAVRLLPRAVVRKVTGYLQASP